MENKVNTRNVILDLLLDVEKGKMSHVAFNDKINRLMSNGQFLVKQDRAFVTRVFQGTLEKQIELDYIINQFSNIKTNKMKPVIRNTLRMSVYQLKYMDSVPERAVVSEAVKIVQKRKFVHLKGFVNGVLRTIIREMDNIKYPTEYPDNLSIEYSVPIWMIELFDEQYGSAKEILDGLNESHETTIRVNTSKASVEDVINFFEYNDVKVRKSELVDEVLYISNYDTLDSLNIFKAGMVTVQNISSVLVGLVADPQPNDCVVDVCAAPGGKALHIAELLNGTGTVEARDLSENKTKLVKQNIKRLDYKNVKVSEHDATKLDESLVEKADIVIADLPCSGLGVIANKSDIKNKMTKEQLDDLQKLQREILETVSKYVKKGGKLIYSTCTINKDENEVNARWIEELGLKKRDIDLKQILGVKELPSNIKEIDGMVQILPSGNMDGFFVSEFVKE